MKGDSINWSRVNRVALQVINDVEAVRSSSLRERLTFYFNKYNVDSKTRSAVSAVAYGVFRNFGRLDWVIGHSTDSCVTALQSDLRNILRIGVLEYTLFTQLPPALIEDACISQFPDSSQERDLLHSHMQKISRRVNSNGISYPSREDLPVEYLMLKSYPRWMVERFIRWYGYENAERLCEAMNTREVRVSLRANLLRVESVAALRRKLEEEGVRVSQARYLPTEALMLDKLPPAKPSLEHLDAYREGLFYVQDESAMLVSVLLDPRSGETIIDLCSAPGGKTTHMAALMGNEAGRIFALDIDPVRLKRVQQNCERLGVRIVRTREADGRRLSLHTLGLSTMAHRVLVDAPCSCLGVLGRHPELRLKIRPSDIADSRRSQSELLNNVSNLVMPGGTVVYSTCTLGPEENDDVVDGFVRRHPQFKIVNLLHEGTRVPQVFIEGDSGFVRTLPHKWRELDGGFAVLLRKGL